MGSALDRDPGHLRFANRDPLASDGWGPVVFLVRLKPSLRPPGCHTPLSSGPSKRAKTSKPTEGEVPPTGCAGVVCANETNNFRGEGAGGVVWDRIVGGRFKWKASNLLPSVV